MIKKILLTFLMVMMCNFANATQCFKLPPKEAATLLSNDTQIQVKIAATHRYEIQKGQCQGGRISAESFWKLCSMAGIDIKTQNGKAQCYNKVAELIEHNGVYYRACGKDAKMLGTKGACINLFKDIQVQTTQGIALAQEFVRITYKLDGLKCKNDRRPADNTDAIEYTNQDFVQCYLPALDKYFEFEFDDLKESSSDRSERDFERGFCKIYGKKVEESFAGAVYCIATQPECAKINESAGKYGGGAKHKSEEKNARSLKQFPDNGCYVSMYGGIIWERKGLKTAYGINNFAFCKGGNLQFQNTGGLTEALKTYVANAAHISPSSVRCNSTTGTYYGGGCNPNAFAFEDDIISCFVGQNRIDFVFDDVYEFSSKYAQGAQQGADCIVAGGTYTGKKCVNMGKEQCELLAKTNLKNCPECKTVKWDGKNCSLPSSATATNIKKGVDITLIVAGAVVGVAVTVATAGEAGAPTLAWVLTGVETLGAGIELGAQLKIDAIADDFLSKSNQCKSASCAQSLIKNNFQHLADSQNDFTEVEISAIDSEMARLASLIPVESDFWAEIGLSSLSLSDNQSGLFENWTPEQAWRAVGIALQMASVVTAVGKWVSTKAKTAVTKLSKSSKVLEQKTKDAVDYVTNTGAQLTPKQLELKQKFNLKVVDPSTLKGDDLELYYLWKKYAPRNQSFEDFKKMGTLSEIREKSKEWTSWDDIEKYNLLDAKIEKVAAKVDKFYETHPGALEDVAKHSPDYVQSKYPELGDLWKEINDLRKEQEKLGNVNLEGNYTTFKNTLTKDAIGKELGDIQKEYDDEWSRVYTSGTEKEKTEVVEHYITKKNDAVQRYLSTQVSEEAIDEVALLRAEQIDKIMNDAPELKNLGARWATLSKEEKLAAAQEISDQLMLRNGVPTKKLPKIIDEKLPDAYGIFHVTRDDEDKIIEAYTKLDLDNLDDFSEFINTMSHEVGGHGINKLNPNAGALGEQMKSVDIGSSSDDVYFIKPEEQSAWRVGDVVEESLKIQ